MNYDKILDIIEDDLKPLDLGGTIPDYIPQLASVSKDKFGMHLYDIQGQHFEFGDSTETFSAQSITKVLTLSLAWTHVGDDIWKRINVEPSGNAYNSLSELERENGIPRNPFINSGALVIADILVTHYKDPKAEFLKFVRYLVNDQSVNFDLNVMQSEAENGYRNVAMVYYLKSLGNIKNNPEKVLDFYFHQCSLSMSCEQLAKAFIVFANHGNLLYNNKEIIPEILVKRINALMQTCGFYDEAGEFTYRVGLPGKSGVGGGIVAVCPQRYAVAVWSPLLNQKGNSKKGMRALEELTALSNTSIF